MEIILIPSNKSKAYRLSFGIFKIAASVVFLLVVITTGIFYSANQFIEKRAESLYHDLYAERENEWENKFEQQRVSIDSIRINAQKNLDTLSVRLSTLQAHLLRLDALGSRLVDIADISDIDFNMLEPPGLGGPSTITLQDSLCAVDLLGELQIVSHKIEDRNEKFLAMESIWLDSDIHTQAIPHGDVVNNSWVSSAFGWRTDPVSGKKEFHRGIDLVAKSGTHVSSSADGIVTWSGQYAGYGNMVEVSHGNSYVTRYAHNKEHLVDVGDRVIKGQSIAVLGSSGRSTGPHVHFEVIKNGKHVNPRKIISIN